MEKQKIKVNYSGSGIRTLNVLGTFLLFIAVIYAVIDVVVFLEDYIEQLNFGGIVKNVISILLRFPLVIFAIGIVCKILSALLKLPLYKRALLEEQYDFYEEEVERKKFFIDDEAEEEENKDENNDNLRQIIETKGVLNGVKYYKELTGCALSDAKKYVDEFISKHNIKPDKN